MEDINSSPYHTINMVRLLLYGNISRGNRRLICRQHHHRQRGTGLLLQAAEAYSLGNPEKEDFTRHSAIIFADQIMKDIGTPNMLVEEHRCQEQTYKQEAQKPFSSMHTLADAANPTNSH